SLRERLNRETQLPLDDAVRIAREVGDALAYAHGHGVVHRDIKPENILLSGGHALVADFGIARALGQSGAERLTETGMAVGTAAYMSPEQSAGDRQLDGRSDVYSLGCVLYEMLAGEPPYTGPTAQAIIAKRFSDPVPSVRRVRQSVPDQIDQAVRRALAPVAADRIPGAMEFARLLEPTGMTAPAPTTEPVAPARGASSAGRTIRIDRRQPTAAVALVLGVLLGLGVLFAWRRSQSSAGEAGGVKVLAVLPFENLGDSADAYFADGVANDVRTKLSRLEGLAVIARGSSNEYRGTTKTQQQIARELGTDYLLTGTIQWERAAGGASRVRVTPELVDVRPGHAPRTRWGQQFDAAMTGVFQVQADIAGQVAQALNLALGDSTRRELAAKPTQSLPAYDHFLRGEAANRFDDPPKLRQAVAAYEKAVALDSAFVEAWAQLGVAQSALYCNSTPTPARAKAARHAAEQALALAPTRPEGHVALGWYYTCVLNDYARTLAEDSTALAFAPGNAELIGNVGWDEMNLGRWEAARAHLEQATRLNPRLVTTTRLLGKVLLATRRYPEAERVYDLALGLEPSDLGARESRAQVAVARGDLAGARAVLRAAPKDLDPTALVAFTASGYLYWLLDEEQQRLLFRLTPSAFDDDRGTWGLALAQIYALRGNLAKARAYGDSARLAYEQQLEAVPRDDRRRASLGLALAYGGDKEAAIREGERAVTNVPISRDAAVGPLRTHLVRIYLLVGEPEKALDHLEPLLEIPHYVSPGWLKIDPTFDPLRGNPRFQRLVNAKP
ncbi:MAG TPA: protein kinase, partial [Gemmatimonadales bacterium]